MTAENEQTILGENASEVPSDSELFAGEVREEFSAGEVFAADKKDSVKDEGLQVPENPTQESVTQQSIGKNDTDYSSSVAMKVKRFSTVQKVLAVSIIAIASILLYTLLKSSSETDSTVTRAPAKKILPIFQQTSSVKPLAEQPHKPTETNLQTQGITQKISKQVPETYGEGSDGLETPTEPLSLKVAQNLYLQKDYDKAYNAYDQLRQNLPKDAEEQLLRDFLQLQMAFCMERSQNYEQANHLLRAVLESDSPVVRALANYHLSFFAMQEKHYLTACTRVYKTIALIGAVDFDRNWVLSLQRDCYFLVAELMTRNVLSLCDGDKDLPEDLWSYNLQTDPFIDLSEEQLRSFLDSGSEKLNKGVLIPKIQKVEHQNGSGSQGHINSTGRPSRWFVICHGASFEELMGRFATNAGLDINLVAGQTIVSGETKDPVQASILRTAAKWEACKRPVSLYLPTATTSQFVTVAAGCVGLLARVDNEKSISIFNPTAYSSLSEHVSLLTEDAVSLWQRLLLMFHDDKRIPKVHFALGLLQAQKNQATGAISEFKLVANRFSQTSLAPFALLHSSKLKASLRDYLGAREDLKQLIEQYPDTNISGRTYLYLADATMRAQLYDEAGQLYRKIYNLNLPMESQIAATLGAGKCSYKKQDYENAAKWLSLYTKLAKDRTGKNLYFGYFLLGKSNLALGKLQQACDAFRISLAGPLSGEEFVEAISALVEGHIKQEHFIEALDTLENVRSYPFSRKESIEILLLRSKILRTMGLVDKAISTLGDRGEYILDPQLKAKIFFELTKCFIAKGQLELARRNLTGILVLVEPGPLSHEVSCELADVCLKLGQYPKSISICSQLLDSELSEQVKQRTLSILSSAYDRQKNYDKAALALLGRWDGLESQNEEGTSENLIIKNQ